MCFCLSVCFQGRCLVSLCLCICLSLLKMIIVCFPLYDLVSQERHFICFRVCDFLLVLSVKTLDVFPSFCISVGLSRKMLDMCPSLWISVGLLINSGRCLMFFSPYVFLILDTKTTQLNQKQLSISFVTV